MSGPPEESEMQPTMNTKILSLIYPALFALAGHSSAQSFQRPVELLAGGSVPAASAVIHNRTWNFNSPFLTNFPLVVSVQSTGTNTSVAQITVAQSMDAANWMDALFTMNVQLNGTNQVVVATNFDCFMNYLQLRYSTNPNSSSALTNLTIWAGDPRRNEL
jgi:hypothetical protein